MKIKTALILVLLPLQACTYHYHYGTEGPKQEIITQASGEGGFLIHTVTKANESLREIASHYTGDENKWKIILESTPGIEENSTYVGDDILIPKHLVTNNSPLSFEIIEPKTEKPKKQILRLPNIQKAVEKEDQQQELIDELEKELETEDKIYLSFEPA